MALNQSIVQPTRCQKLAKFGVVRPSPSIVIMSLDLHTDSSADWSLLSEDLHFLYVDPVLQNHLDAQANAFIGKSLIEFVHPDEQASAKQDLGDVLASRTLHGSVTR